MPRVKPIVLMLATALVALVAAPASHAAIAEVSGNAVVYDLDKINPFAQDLSVAFTDGDYIFTESGPEDSRFIRGKAKCSKDSGKVVRCKGDGVTRGVVETEDLDDFVELKDSVKIPFTFSMGQGSDQAVGSSGDDHFLGGLLSIDGLGNDTFEGNAGKDKFDAGLNADIMKGGPDEDTVDYSVRLLRQTVSLDKVANDGDPSDLADIDTASLSGADNVLDIENIVGGSVRDTLTGDENANKLVGNASDDDLEGKGGRDTFDGGNGNDTIDARTPTPGVPDPDEKINCGRGNDRVLSDTEDQAALIGGECEDIDCGGCEVPDQNGQVDAPGIAAIDPPGGANDVDEGTGPGGSGVRPDPDGPGPQPAPPILPPSVKIVSGGVVPLQANGTIPVRIVCLYRANRCKGTLALKAKVKISARIGRRVRTFNRNATIATANLAPIPWGNSAPVQLRANALFRTILPLLRRPNTKVTALLASQDADGGANAPTARASGDLTVAAKRKRR